MQKKIPSYMRTHRRQWGLTQKELAHLLGAKSGTQISRYEHLLRRPKLYIALACQVIFGALPHKIFPKLFSEVEEGVMQRASQLYRKLQGGTTQATKRKLALLQKLLGRDAAESNDDEV